VKKNKFIGIEIGGTKLQIVCGYGDGTLLDARQFAVDKEEGSTGIRKKIQAFLKEFKTDDVTSIGVGFGGPVNRFTGKIETSFHIEGWSGFPLKTWLEDLTGLPAVIENDANVAALGEATHGAGKEYQKVLYITLGSGVGGGLIIDKKIYHGDVPGEIEIGHIQMDRKGTTLQDVCSGWAVDAKIKSAVAMDPDGTLARLINGNQKAEAKCLNDALKENDPVARQIFDEMTDDFAFGLSHAIHLLHPEVVVLGGGLSLMGDILEKEITKKLQRYLMSAFSPGPRIKLSNLKEMAVPAGALVLCSQSKNQKRMEPYLSQYIKEHKETLEAIPLKQVSELIERFLQAWKEDRKIFVFGNGGSAANASHFVTDLGKGASDTLSRPFRCLSINDNVPWITALGNDYHFDEVFSRQLNNFAVAGDILFVMSVSGNSPNLVSAIEWGKKHGVFTIALVGGKRGKLADLADQVLVIDSTHYGRVEDAHMTICHMICYAFMEKAVDMEGAH
jgi:glucokinase